MNFRRKNLQTITEKVYQGIGKITLKKNTIAIE